MTCYRSLSLAALCVLSITASATTIRRLSLDEVRDRAEMVFTGYVISSSPLAVMNGSLTATRYTVAVDEVLHGTPGTTTTITYLGAGKNGAPSLDRGVRYLFFKTGQPNDTTVGWGQGLYRFETITTSAGLQTILVSGDGEPLVMMNGTLARGPRVQVISGHITSDATTTGEPQDSFVAANADGSAAPRVEREQRTPPAASAYATLDDLSRFVASGHVRNR